MVSMYSKMLHSFEAHYCFPGCIARLGNVYFQVSKFRRTNLRPEILVQQCIIILDLLP
jgi:hypothetical protein